MAKYLKEGYNIRINRYMNLEKLEELLIEKYLWFNKLNNFDDLHEGRALVDWENNNIETIDRWREKFVCSCWNRDEGENFTLWNIYLKGSTTGICIVSTRNDVMNSIVEEEEIENYFINYVKHGETLNQFSSIDTITTKYDWYSYENEFRFLKYIKEENPNKGIKVEIQPHKLINGIILSPNMDKATEEKVFKLCREFNIPTSKISNSIIKDKIFPLKSS